MSLKQITAALKQLEQAAQDFLAAYDGLTKSPVVKASYDQVIEGIDHLKAAIKDLTNVAGQHVNSFDNSEPTNQDLLDAGKELAEAVKELTEAKAVIDNDPKVFEAIDKAEDAFRTLLKAVSYVQGQTPQLKELAANLEALTKGIRNG